jgi:Ca2+-binding EF-hand superfamily protein
MSLHLLFTVFIFRTSIIRRSLQCVKSASLYVLKEIVTEIDADASGSLDFNEFVQLAAKFLIEEDEEQMRWELREAFRLYDKQGMNMKVETCLT